MTNNQYAICNDCMHQSGIGFDAWCEFGIKKHRIDEKPIFCDAYKSNKHKSKVYTKIEIKDREIILWKENMGQKFTYNEFLRFLNQKYTGD